MVDFCKEWLDQPLVVGEEWIYCAPRVGVSERVRIIEIVHVPKRQPRVRVEFLDPPKAGLVEEQPRDRLSVRWSELGKYKRAWAGWASLRKDRKLSEFETWPLHVLFRSLVPPDVAAVEWSPVQDSLRVADVLELEKLVGCPMSEVTRDVRWFELDGQIFLSPAGAVKVCEFACRNNVSVVVEWLTAQDLKWREKCSRDKDDYEFYESRVRRVHELIRSWCGVLQVVEYEQRLVTERENDRLHKVLIEHIAELRQRGEEVLADQLEWRRLEKATILEVHPAVEPPAPPPMVIRRARRRVR